MKSNYVDGDFLQKWGFDRKYDIKGIHSSLLYQRNFILLQKQWSGISLSPQGKNLDLALALMKSPAKQI